MGNRKTIQVELRRYNRWRRGDERINQPDPKRLGELIDSAAERLDVLEREHAEFFERWHKERQRREKLQAAVEVCHAMLLAEPSAKVARGKAEEILFQVLAG